MKSKVATKKESRIGLDIGTRLIKAVLVSLEEGKKTLQKLSSETIELPSNTENTKNALKSLLGALQPSVKEVNISLSAPSAIVRFITLPRMKKDELKDSLRFEAEKYIPFNIDEVFLDAVILKREAEKKTDMKVLLAAAKKEAVNSRLELLKGEGFSVSAIDVDGFACFNAFCDSVGNLDETKSIALLNMGYTQTNVLIAIGTEPCFTRDIQIGAKDASREISKNLQVEEKDARQLLIERKDNAANVAETIKPVLSNLSEELRLSFGYYENQFGKSVNEIYISGGMAKLSGVSEALEQAFGMKPVLWDPFSKFEIAPEIDKNVLNAERPKFGVSAGLGMRL